MRAGSKKPLIIFLGTIGSIGIIMVAGQINLYLKENKTLNDAQMAVKMHLKDPSSAEFRNLNITTLGSVCGEVNARNSLGGYTGFQRFVYSRMMKDVHFERGFLESHKWDDNTVFDKLYWNVECR